VRVEIRELFQEVAGSGETHIVTRETGRKIRAAAARRLQEMEGGGLLTLDFSGTGIIDYSCADEFVAKLLTRLIAGEYGERYLRLANLNPSQKENIDVALERKRLPSILVNPDRTWQCLGTIKPYLYETLNIVMSRERVSARDLSALLKIELNTSSTRLINLHRQRLVRRRERTISEGGREFVYAGLVEASLRGEELSA
jgi:hypothetical protein